MSEPPRDDAALGRSTASREARLTWRNAALVTALALLVFGARLAAEPHFMDESAYISQSYFAALFAEGLHNDPAWLDYPAYDLPPLPKYMIGAALWSAGYKTPGPADARAWYANTARRFDPPGALEVARIPSVVVGASGCIALYGIGVIVGGRGIGTVAALLLIANPLYRLLSRRAMSDVPCEAFMLCALVFFLWAWRGLLSGRLTALTVFSVAAAGAASGFALLSKLSGMLALLVIAGWAALALVTKLPFARKVQVVAAAAIVPLAAAATFVILDPFLTVQPARAVTQPFDSIAHMSFRERVRMMFLLRLEVSAGQKKTFPHNALVAPYEKLATIAVQGFGRFGPFGPSHSDSTKWFDFSQDWGAIVWLPWVAAGGVWAAMRGRSQASAGDAPTAWALLAYAVVAFVVVTAYIPMAWDRYQLAIQAPAALLAAGAAAAGAGWLKRALVIQDEGA
jgi:4-amino-4-deoxy-L-arabinose transferase-like glycosyltransferase